MATSDLANNPSNVLQQGISCQITVGLIGNHHCDSHRVISNQWTPRHDYIEKDFGTLIDIGRLDDSTGFQSINALATCDILIICMNSMELKSQININDETVHQWIRKKWRYLQIARIFGVKHFIVAIVVPDEISAIYPKGQFHEMQQTVKRMMNQMNIEEFNMIPIWEFNGNDIFAETDNMEWYVGPSLIEMIYKIKASMTMEKGSCICRILHCYTNSIVGCKVRRGSISVGDNIKIFPAGIRGKVISIKKNSVSVWMAHCGDIIGLKVKSTHKMLVNVKPGAMVMFDEDPGKEEAIEILYRFKALILVETSWDRARWEAEHQNEEIMSNSTDSTERFISVNSEHDVISRNGRSRCRILSIEWKQNVQNESGQMTHNGESAEVVMEVSADSSSDSTPLNMYPESCSFFMICSSSEYRDDTLISGKVVEILETKSLCSIYHFGRIRDRTEQRGTTFSDIYAFAQLKEAATFRTGDCPNICPECKCWDKDSNQELTEDCKQKLRDLVQHRHTRSCSASDLDICTVKWKSKSSECEFAEALTCSVGIVVCFCAQIARMLQRVIPREVVQIIKANLRGQLRKAYRRKSARPRVLVKVWLRPGMHMSAQLCAYHIDAYHNSPDDWNLIEQLKGKTIRKMESMMGHSVYLEENGNVWECHESEYHVQSVFLNKIMIKDVAVGVDHCLVVDSKGMVYSWGNNEWGECGHSFFDNQKTPKMINFPNLKSAFRCFTIKCGKNISYVRLRMKDNGVSGREWHSDLHYLFGRNNRNQCLTVDDWSYYGWTKNKVVRPFCINQVVKEKIGGVIEDVDIESNYKETIVVVMRHFLRLS